MPNTRSALKSLRKTKRLTLKNEAFKRHLHAIMKKCKTAIAAKKFDDAEKLFIEASRAFDKAGQRHIVKRNTAARRKSRLAKQLNAAKK